ncbi:MAG: ATP-binding protein [Defluviitaleaceae bacterium]|nr:ATP-binding protein [Defluviitaleaceae bacterium]
MGEFWWAFVIVIGMLVGVAAVLFVNAQKARKDNERLEKLLKEQEEKLRTETATLNAIFQALPDVMFCKDLELRYTHATKSFGDLFGLSTDDVVGKSDEELGIDSEKIGYWRSADLEVINQAKTLRLDEVVPALCGDVVFETIKTPLMQDGHVYGLLGMARDMTRRKEYENQLHAASQAKSAFLANMSHEIRTPMNSIVGFSELAMEIEASPKVRNYLNKISENANLLLHIINDILDISKLETGEIMLEEVAFDLGELTDQCKALVLPTIAEKNLDFYTYIEPVPGDKLVVCDPLRLRQVLINILSNAAKFTHQGGIKMVSSVIADMGESVTIYWEISDTGIGMTEEQIARVFEPFMQADTAKTRQQGGVGLGLPIVRGVLEAMGGGLDIRSRIREGTTVSFSLMLPVAERVAGKTQTLTHIGKKPYFEGTVLVCEDNEMNQMVISDHLQRVGLSCVIAHNGEEGLDIVTKSLNGDLPPFDLILMDIHMPTMDGIEAAGRILKMGCKVPIVALTANIMPENLETYQAAGMVDHIGKPFIAQELWAVLYKHLKPVDETEVADQIRAPQSNNFDDAKLTKALIVSFVKDNSDFYERLELALKDRDTATAYRLAHTVKSSAGILGKIHLQKAAIELEASLKTDAQKGQSAKEVTASTMRKLKMELNAVLEELIPIYQEELCKQGERDDSITYTTDEIREIIDQLEGMLKSRNASSVSMITKLASLPDAWELIEQIEAFDFKAALETLSGLKEGWVMPCDR